MFGAHALIDNITVVAAAAAGCIGFVAFWSNPTRGMNRAVFSGSLHVSIWLVFRHYALTSADGLFWLRLSCAIGAWMPLHICIVQETITARLGCTFRSWLVKHRAWIVTSVS